jgi:hypothetical protein
MKPKQQNNPVLLGVLSVAFVFILIRIFKTLTGGGDLPPAPANPEAAAQEGSKTVALQSASAKFLSSVKGSQRDPFDHPHLLQLAEAEIAKQKQANGEAMSIPTPKAIAQSRPFARGSFRVGLPSIAPPSLGSKPILSGFTHPQSAQSVPDAATTGSQSSTAQTTTPVPIDLTEKWRVTAILGGSHPTAILEGAESTPRTIRVGDEFQGYHIAAIRKNEIVISSARRVLTLPLDIRMDDAKTTPSADKSPIRLAAQTPSQEK